MKNKKLKYIIAVFLIILFTFSVVNKTFQNDTYYIIELGNRIMKTGVDWIDHYSIHDNLEYIYPHWAFDVLNALIYNNFGFVGIYVATQIFASIFMLIVFWNMLKKDIDFNLAFISTLIVAYMMKGNFYERGQIISISLFLIEYIILERFVQRPTLFKTLGLLILSIIMANVHSTSWFMMLILLLPFVGEQIVYFYSLRGINERLLKKYKKKYKKAKDSNASEEKLEKIENEIKHQEEVKKIYEKEDLKEKKIIVEKKPNAKYLWIAFVALIIGSLISPLKFTLILYFIKTSVGDTMSYINEHLPVVPASNLEFFSYSAIIIALLGFTKSKLKLHDAFLVLGLYLMALSSRRSVYLLIGLTSGIIVKMIDDFIKINIFKDVIKSEEVKKRLFKLDNIIYKIICILAIVVGCYMFIIKVNDPFISKKEYPVDAVKFIKENLDYNNIRMFNGYDYGSYLLMNRIPVFIDSRCDLYTPQFNKGINVFDDYMKVIYGQKTITKIMKKYNLDYALVKKDDMIQNYMAEDDKYTEIYKDKYFVIYEFDGEK